MPWRPARGPPGPLHHRPSLNIHSISEPIEQGLTEGNEIRGYSRRGVTRVAPHILTALTGCNIGLILDYLQQSGKAAVGHRKAFEY